jgi:hypothetical protein
MFASYLRTISNRTKQYSDNLAHTQNKRYSIFGIGYEIKTNKTTGYITSLNLFDKNGVKHIINVKDTPTKFRLRLNKCGDLSIEEISSDFLDTKSGVGNLAYDELKQGYDTYVELKNNGIKFFGK